MEGITEPSLLLMCYDLMSGKETQPATLSPTASEVPAASDFLFDDLVENDLVDELPGDAEAVTLTLVAAAGGDRLDKWLVVNSPNAHARRFSAGLRLAWSSQAPGR